MPADLQDLDPPQRVPSRLSGAVGSALLYFSSNIGAKLLGFAYFLLLARWIDVTTFGMLTFAAAIAVIADTAADLGMGRVILREVALDSARAARVAGIMVPAKLGVSLMIFAAVVLLLPARYHTAGTVAIFAIYAIWLAASSVAILLEQIMHAQGRFGYASGARILPGLVQIAAGGMIHFAGGTARGFAFAAALSGLSYLVVVLAALRHLGLKVVPAFGIRTLIRALRGALPFALVSTLLLLSLKVEFLVVGQISDARSVGLYGMAARLYEAGLTAPIAFATVLTPRLIRSLEIGRGEFEQTYAQAMRILSVGAVAVMLVGIVLVDPVLSVLLPASYAGAKTLLIIMLAGFPLVAVHLLNASAMLALPEQRRPALMMGGLVGIQAILAFLSVSVWGVQGAAASMVASALIAAAVSSVAARSWMMTRSMFLRASFPAIAGALVGGAGLMLAYETAAPYGQIAALLAAALVMAAMHGRLRL